MARDGDGRLGFPAASEAFGFLESLGFHRISVDESLAVYESRALKLEVYHGRYSYQLGVNLEILSTGEVFSLPEVLGCFAPSEIGWSRWQTSDAPGVQVGLRAIAAVLVQHCAPLLRGELEPLDKLRTSVKSPRAQATAAARFGAVLDRADEAWCLRDFSRALELYLSGEGALSSAQRRRLNYLKSGAAKGRWACAASTGT
jgi:hypothetical protein